MEKPFRGLTHCFCRLVRLHCFLVEKYRKPLGESTIAPNTNIKENGAVVGISDGKCQITKGGEIIESIPVNTLDGITILGKSQLTTQMAERFLLGC